MRKLALLLGLLAAPFAFVDTTSCGPSLPIATSGTGELEITTFADGRQIRHVDVDVTLTANGKTVTNISQNNQFVDGTTQTIVGAVVLFEAGPHEQFSGDLAALCAYFSSP